MAYSSMIQHKHLRSAHGTNKHDKTTAAGNFTEAGRTAIEAKRSGSARLHHSCRDSPFSITMHGGSSAPRGSLLLLHIDSTLGRNCAGPAGIPGTDPVLGC